MFRSPFSGIVLFLAACSGDPGSSIPDRAPEGTPPAVDPSAPAPGAAPGDGSVSLTVDVQGTGAVRSEPAGIDCPGRCAATFAPGARVKLVAAPAEGWQLSKWSGACSGGGACEVVVDSNVAVTGSLALLDPRWDPSVGARDCADAWGAKGEKLSPCDTVKDDYVVVSKAKRNVALCKSGKLVKNLRSGLGFAPKGAKQQQGDGKTPEGVFYVPRVLPDSSFYKAFLLSYPTVEDANRGVSTGLITNAERSQIVSAHEACVEPPQYTDLGGELEIHGNGSTEDWTHGCVAVEDDAIDLLWSSIGAGDSIVVKP